MHGWGGSFASTWKTPGWDMLLGDIGRKDVIGVDLLGHGTAPKPHDPSAYENLGSRILESLPSTGTVDAIGFSLGAMTLLHTATQHPDRFGRIVLSGIGNGLFHRDPELSARQTDAIEAALKGEGDGSNTWAQAMARYAGQSGNDPVALIACMRRALPANPITVESCARVTCPVLVCIGDNDFAAPADELAAAFPNGKLKVLRNTDHFATPEAFGFIDAVLAFLG